MARLSKSVSMNVVPERDISEPYTCKRVHSIQECSIHCVPAKS